MCFGYIKVIIFNIFFGNLTLSLKIVFMSQILIYEVVTHSFSEYPILFEYITRYLFILLLMNIRIICALKCAIWSKKIDVGNGSSLQAIYLTEVFLTQQR